jgi:hypothetical protein
MKLGSPADDVSVTARLNEVDQASAGVGTGMERAQVNDRPLNGRNRAWMLPLIAGAVDPGTSDQRSVGFGGHGRDCNNFTLEGVDAAATAVCAASFLLIVFQEELRGGESSLPPHVRRSSSRSNHTFTPVSLQFHVRHLYSVGPSVPGDRRSPRSQSLNLRRIV